MPTVAWGAFVNGANALWLIVRAMLHEKKKLRPLSRTALPEENLKQNPNHS